MNEWTANQESVFVTRAAAALLPPCLRRASENDDKQILTDTVLADRPPKKNPRKLKADRINIF